MEGKDPVTGRPRFSFADTAKTVWLAANTHDQTTHLLPFGWLLIEVEPFDDPERPTEHMADLCESHLAGAQALAETLARKERGFASRREELMARRREEEARLRERTERDAAAARAAEEQRKRVEALSANQREAEALRAEMNLGNRNRGPGDQLYSRVRSLIQDADAWPEADRAGLRDVAAEILDWLGIKKDDTNRKKLLRGLLSSQSE